MKTNTNVEDITTAISSLMAWALDQQNSIILNILGLSYPSPTSVVLVFLILHQWGLNLEV